ncbi:cytoplasmic protein [Fischerella thermalis CCMEE 5273]|nr:cytoplasmic protein [Fischerella thermalis CCMEE 5273]
MEYDPKLMNRMKRINGQVQGIIKMMEEGKDCKELVSQMTAARHALDRAAALMVSMNLEKCLREQIEKGESTQETVNEAVSLLVKSR